MIYNSLDEMIANAMKSRDKDTLSTLRMIKSQLLTSVKNGVEINDKSEPQILLGMIADRNKAIVEFKKGGRADLVSEAEKEIDIISNYLPVELRPKKVSEDELREFIKNTIEKHVAEQGEGYVLSMKDMKPIIAIVKSEYDTPMAGALVSKILKEMI